MPPPDAFPVMHTAQEKDPRQGRRYPRGPLSRAHAPGRSPALPLGVGRPPTPVLPSGQWTACPPIRCGNNTTCYPERRCSRGGVQAPKCNLGEMEHMVTRCSSRAQRFVSFAQLPPMRYAERLSHAPPSRPSKQSKAWAEERVPHKQTAAGTHGAAWPGTAAPTAPELDGAPP